MSAVLKPGEPWVQPRLRPMRETDLVQVVRIERAAYPYPWTLGNFRDSLQAGYSCWVAEVDGELIGYYIVMAVAGEGHLLNCCVAPAWQGRGYGRWLAQKAIENAREHGAACIFLEVRPSNAPALRLYQRLGFSPIARRRGYYPADHGREDALVMKLDL
ncbi:MAG: ribosomal protein S18-alanine N-acetyltransferase [Thiobacillaceae bacterium]|nr:ribosomal protein S18-alanine N-acetyltransferase [Thiobacillaceae bacterium]